MNVPAQQKTTAVGFAMPMKKGLEEGVSREEIIIPRAKLLQALSPEVVEDKSKPRIYEPGIIINSLTKEVLPEEFIPILKFTEWIRFNPRKKDDANFDPAFDSGALIWRSRNPEDTRVIEQGKFGENGERPAATRFMNFLSYFPGCQMPVIVSFCNTSFKAGKKLLNILQFSPGKDIYSRKFSLITKQETNDMGTYFVLDINPAGEPSEEEHKMAEGWYSQLKPFVDRIEVHEVQENQSFEE